MAANSLPSQPTPFIGREKELSDIAALLADPNCRLLTLVGSGGIGKTRLALQAAASQQPRFADGVSFVPLTPIASSNLLASAIETALEIPRIQIMHYLREKQMLLVMDNFEHLLQGTGLLTELLQAAPGLKILATSRERLNLQEEWVFALDGLSYPIEPFAGLLENYSAVQLFVQRARQVQVHFSLDNNAQAVLSICRQVEGMPLGLELAASWLRGMSCQQIVAQMASNLDFLTTPLRNIPERHRSLRNVFEQSWNLLSGDEQAVLMRLSVFHGGFDLEAAEQVADASPLLLAGLVDKSLIRLNTAGRYDLHELLRQYASDKLVEAGAADNTAHRHLDYFMKLTERGEAYLFGREQIPWFDRLEVEFNNLRAALSWSLRDEEHEAGLRLVTTLCWFFTERDHPTEGLEWVERLLTLNPDAPPSLRAKVLHSAGALASYMKDEQQARAYCEEALTLSRPLNDRWNMAWSLSHLGFSVLSDLDLGVKALEESLMLFRDLSDPLGLGHTLVRRSFIAFKQMDYAYARVLLQEAFIIAREADDKIITGWVNNLLGSIAWYQDDDLRQAKIYYQDSLSGFREARFEAGVNQTLRQFAAAEHATGNDVRAQVLYRETLNLLRESTDNVDVDLAGLASIASAHGQFVRAATLLGAVKNGNALILWARLYPKLITYKHDIDTVREQLDNVTFAEAWAAGNAMTREQSIAYALEDKASRSKISLASPAADQPLTERELEILHLIGDGLNSREIAQKLVLSVGTIRWYLKQIYSKLNVHGRSEAIARAKTLNILT